MAQGNCLRFSSGICYKSTTADYTREISGNCTPCLLSMLVGGYNLQRIEIPARNQMLLSGARVQYLHA